MACFDVLAPPRSCHTVGTPRFMFVTHTMATAVASGVLLINRSVWLAGWFAATSGCTIAITHCYRRRICGGGDSYCLFQVFLAQILDAAAVSGVSAQDDIFTLAYRRPATG